MVFDEAGQIPLPHAIAGMALARRWMMFGDHHQLSPVITADHADREVTESAFERFHRLYDSQLLDTTYRMNAGLCEVVSGTFYGGGLRSAQSAEGRQMPFGKRGGSGALDSLLDPQHSVVLARIDHTQPGLSLIHI